MWPQGKNLRGILRAVHDDKELVLILIIGFIAEAKLIHTYSFFCHVVINPGRFIDTIFLLNAFPSNGYLCHLLNYVC